VHNVRGIPFHRLSVFIGENDAGKTAIVDALEILLTSASPSSDDFRLAGDNHAQANKIRFKARFPLELHDTLPEDYRAADGTQLILVSLTALD
jgi:predicted ATP-dependent endonuclease of OLD family